MIVLVHSKGVVLFSFLKEVDAEIPGTPEFQVLRLKKLGTLEHSAEYGLLALQVAGVRTVFLRASVFSRRFVMHILVVGSIVVVSIELRSLELGRLIEDGLTGKLLMRDRSFLGIADVKRL